MQNILKSSSKLGLIAAVLLLASACGSDEAKRDPGSSTETPSPLVKVQEISAGDECEHGGSMIINGIDKDGDGELSEDEILSSKAVCKTAPTHGEGPGNNENNANPLIKSETLDVGDADCPNGGQSVLAGLDSNDDGILSADEVKSTTLLCTETGVCSGATPLELVDAIFERDPYGQYEIGQEYEIRVEFNQVIDKSRVTIQDAVGSLGSGPLEYEVDEENNHIAILKWTAREAQDLPLLAMIEDGCSLAAADGSLPSAIEPRAQVRVKSELLGLVAEGDKAEVCWTSRNADKCEFFELHALVGPVELNGCMDLELTADHIAEPTMTMNYSIRCEGTDDNNVLTSQQSTAPLYKAPALHYFFGEQPMMIAEEGRTTKLYWDSFGMESCTLSDGTDTNPVEKTSIMNSDSPYSVEIPETTTFELSCEDVLGQTHQYSLRYLVGPGILVLNGGLYAPGNALSVSWQTVDVDGTCDVKYSNSGVTLEYTDIAQNAVQDHDGFDLRNGGIYMPNIDTSVFDLAKDELHEITCYNADKSKSYSHTYIK